MRREPSPAEEASVAALVSAFLRDGRLAAIIPREISDKPDALLEVAGVRIACECIQVPPQYIYQHHCKHFPADAWSGKDILSIVWPNEPHHWVAEAIRKKSKLHAGYLQATGATESWLLIHSPLEPTQSFLDGSKEWIQWALRHGAKMVDHPFSQIFLWTPQGGIQPISVRRNEVGTHSELGINFASGYPTLCVNRFSIPFSTLARGESGSSEWELKFFESNKVVIEPQDPEYLRHAPAHRCVSYLVHVRVWVDRAELNTSVEFGEGESPVVLQPQRIEGLRPSTDYWYHALHEFQAPKQLSTYRAVQPY